MKKKLVAATVTAAVIMSTTSVFAAGLALPGGSKLGKTEKPKDVVVNLATKSELKYDKDSHAKLKHEAKLYFDGKIDDVWTAEAGLNIETKTDNGKESETEKWEMENLWLQYQKSPEFSLRFGRQTYHLAKGLYIDQDGVMGGKAIYNLDKDNILEVFVGRDDQDLAKAGLKMKKGKVEETPASKTALLEVVNLAHKFDKAGSLGAYYAKQQLTDHSDNWHFWGLYGNCVVNNKTDFNFEYLKNTTKDAHGYVAELKFGNLKKSGDWTYALEYMDADANLTETNSYTDFDSQIADPELGWKGPGVIVANKLSKNSQLQLQRWWGKDKINNDAVPVTKLTLNVKF